MKNVIEVISTSFEIAMGSGKRSDSFSNALMLMSLGRTSERIRKLLNATFHHEEKESLIELFTDYFRGDASFSALEKRLGTTRW